MSHNIAPSIGNHCRTAPTGTRGINRSGDFQVRVGQSDDGNKLGPQTGAQREGKNDE